jgi:hypothetical protein
MQTREFRDECLVSLTPKETAKVGFLGLDFALISGLLGEFGSAK